MIISQLMLTGFVAYWLKSQYDNEKDLLREELSRIYEESRNQVIDSLLFNRVVEPALNDSITITMMTAETSDTTRHDEIRSFGSATPAWSKDTCKSTMVAIKLPDSLRDKGARPEQAFAFSNKKQDILIRSVKLFINHSGDSTLRTGEFPGFLSGNPDTALFKRIYSERIEQKDIGITVIWVSDSLKNKKNLAGFKVLRNAGEGKSVSIIEDGNDTVSPGSGKNVIHFSSMVSDNLPGLMIRHDFSYLAGQILPQIVFGLILLLLTGSAFFFTNRSLKRQVILNSLRNDFVSNITHELRTPVSTVKVAIEALKTYDKASNPAIMNDYLDMAGQELNRLDQLIGKVLDQSLISEQKQVIQTQSSDLKHLIESVLLSLQPRLTARNASVEFIASEIIGAVMVDPLHFQGVLINLIDNSLKYGPEYPVIHIRLRQAGRYAMIEVGDNGPGIPKEYLSRVFDKFFRVPAGNTHNVKGYGLGLSFAALVMNQHQGSISVKNLDEGGCEFTLRFPIQTA